MAELPEGAVKLGLDMAGFFMLHDGVPCYFLPGVPNEMEHLLEETVIPDLETQVSQQVRVSQAHCPDSGPSGNRGELEASGL